MLKDIDDIDKKCRKLLIAKNHDYASSEDPYKNLRQSEQIGIPAWKGTFIRYLDKHSRMCNFILKGEYAVKDENFEDTIDDALNYLKLVKILYKRNEVEQENKKNT